MTKPAPDLAVFGPAGDEADARAEAEAEVKAVR